MIVKIYRHYFVSGMVSALDEGIGNITNTFKEKGMWDNTVVIFTTGTD